MSPPPTAVTRRPILYRFDAALPLAGPPGNPRLARAIIRDATIKPNSLLLDVGCGFGQNTRLLAAMSRARVLGLDSEHAQANRTRGFLAVRADCQSLPFSEAIFDHVTACFMIQLVQDQQQFIREVKRVLKKGGKFCVPLPSRQDIRRRIVGRIFPWISTADLLRYPTITGLCKLLRAQGFRVKTRRIFLGNVKVDEQYLRVNLALKHSGISGKLASLPNRLEASQSLLGTPGIPSVYRCERTLLVAEKL